MKIILSVVLSLLFIATPAMAQQAVVAFSCAERDHAETLAGEMTESNVMAADPRWLTCRPVGMPVDDMSDAPPPFMGPLTDWEDDPFAIYLVQDVYLIVYWLKGYHPGKDA